MKRIAFRLIAVVLALSVAASAILIGAAADVVFEEEIAYSFNGRQFICSAAAVLSPKGEEDVEEEEGDRYNITFVFDSVPVPITAHLSEFCYSFDNTQLGVDHVYRQELWDVLAQFGLDLYSNAYGRDMVGRSPEGAARELQMHYWMSRLGNTVMQMTKPIELIAGKVQPFAKLFKMVKTLYRRAAVTELGPTDGSDLNGYIFEQGNSDLQCLFLYGRDFLSLGVMVDLVDQTDRLEPDVLARIDQFMFYPNELEKAAEILYVDTRITHEFSAC